MVSDSCCICNKKCKDGSILMFAVPKNMVKRKKWSSACGKTLKASFKICQIHFHEDDLIRTGDAKKTHLKTNAVPSVDIANSNDNVLPDTMQFINEELFDAKMGIAFDSKDYISKSVQTGYPETRTCGLIEMSMGTKEYNLNCFYCPEQFLIWNWTDFVSHMQEKHQDFDKMFENSDSLYHENTYLEKPSDNSLVDAKKESDHEEMETEEVNVLMKTEFKTEMEEGETEKPVMDEIAKTTTVQPIPDVIDISVKLPAAIASSSDNDYEDEKEEEEDSLQTKEMDQICIGTTDPATVLHLFELLKDYPLLWQSRNANRASLTELTQKINEKWNLSITTPQMSRSLYSIKKWYHRVLTSKDKRVLNDKDKKEYFNKCKDLQDMSTKLISVCDLCKRTFFCKIQLQVHKFKLHKIGEMPFKCSRCNYGFADAEKAKIHESTHEKVRNFFCKICDQGFFYEKMLKAHMFIHTEDYKPVCELCGKKFPSLGKYRKHKVYHETPKFTCDICHKSYYQKWTLTEHMKSHENERHYVCKQCGKTFIRLKTLQVHQQGIHGSGSTNSQVEMDDDSTEMNELNSNNPSEYTNPNTGQCNMLPLDIFKTFL